MNLLNPSGNSLSIPGTCAISKLKPFNWVRNLPNCARVVGSNNLFSSKIHTIGLLSHDTLNRRFIK